MWKLSRILPDGRIGARSSMHSTAVSDSGRIVHCSGNSIIDAVSDEENIEMFPAQIAVDVDL
jgi:hypothetical protein